MTRDEEVRNAIDTIIPIFRSNNGRTYEQALMASGFEAGVKWADTHPKSTWISVEEDLPCNHKELMKNKYYTKKVLVILAWNGNPAKRHIELCDMCSKIEPCDTNWSWRKPTYYHVTHWMPIPKLPK